MQGGERWFARVAVLALAFAAGWAVNGGSQAHAQGYAAQVELQDSNLYVYYPDQATLYIYSAPLAGGPERNCAYKIVLSSPGGRITRQQCPYNP